MKLNYLWLLGLLLLCACSSNFKNGITENPEDFDLRTNQTVYLAEPTAASLYAFSLTAELENTTGQTLYLDLCDPEDTTPIYGVVSAEASVERSAWNPAWACVGHSESVALEPGQTRTDTYVLEGPTASSEGQPDGALEGFFRVIYRTLACADSDTCAPDTITSNAFEIELAD